MLTILIEKRGQYPFFIIVITGEAKYSIRRCLDCRVVMLLAMTRWAMERGWIPACAGMTVILFSITSCHYERSEVIY